MTGRKDIHNSDIPSLCRACEIRHKGICGAMAPEQLVAASKTARRHTFDAGALIHTEGDEANAYHVILSGLVRLTKSLADGRYQTTELQSAPDLVGQLLQNCNATSAEAVTDVEVCSFPKTVIDRLVTENIDVKQAVIKQVLGELDEVREWMTIVGQKAAREKVASFIYRMALRRDPTREDWSQPIDLSMSRSDIAALLGLTIESVSRQMTRLKTDGVIELEDSRLVRIPSIARLAGEAGI